MIRMDGLVKRYGDKTAVDNITIAVAPGRVTGFLGPNGAGKSTTMRMIVGLETPTSGTVTVNGRPYRDHRAPLLEVGALLDAKAVHPGRSAYNHLRAMAATHGISTKRVHEVIGMAGLESVAHKRAGGFSLGMGQRLGIATALLGDPHTLILDEPVNGLDPEGVIWVRQFVRQFAAHGRTVLISSHLMSEMAKTADQIIVLGRGRVLADAAVGEFTAADQPRVRVLTPNASELAALMRGAGATVSRSEDSALEVTGLAAPAIAGMASDHRIPIHELTPILASLEDAYIALTADSVEYRAEVAA